METIGERAAQAIKRRVRYGRIKPECDRINIPVGVVYDWANGVTNPSAYYLQQMALAGYDVHYILTGVKKQ